MDSRICENGQTRSFRNLSNFLITSMVDPRSSALAVAHDFSNVLVDRMSMKYLDLGCD